MDFSQFLKAGIFAIRSSKTGSSLRGHFVTRFGIDKCVSIWSVAWQVFLCRKISDPKLLIGELPVAIIFSHGAIIKTLCFKYMSLLRSFYLKGDAFCYTHITPDGVIILNIMLLL